VTTTEPSLSAGRSEAPEPGRHGAGDFLQPRMHVFGGVDDLPGEHRVLVLHAFEAMLAGLELGDADHVVIGHRHRDVFGGGIGQRVGLGGAAVAAVEFEELHQPVEVLVGVGGVLEIGQPLDAGENDIVQRPRKFADARQETVKLGMACECRQ